MLFAAPSSVSWLHCTSGAKYCPSTVPLRGSYPLPLPPLPFFSPAAFSAAVWCALVLSLCLRVRVRPLFSLPPLSVPALPFAPVLSPSRQNFARRRSRHSFPRPHKTSRARPGSPAHALTAAHGSGGAAFVWTLVPGPSPGGGWGGRSPGPTRAQLGPIPRAQLGPNHVLDAFRAFHVFLREGEGIPLPLFKHPACGKVAKTWLGASWALGMGASWALVGR